MRASRHPESARSAAEHFSDRRRQRDSGRFQIVRLRDQQIAAMRRRPESFASAAGSCGNGAAAGARHPANTCLVGTATPGLTSTAGKRRRAQAARKAFHRCRASAAGADRGRPARRRRSRAPHRAARGSSRDSPLARAIRRSAAAASDEPPPRPAATGSLLSRRKVPMTRPGRAAASARAALSTRLSAVVARLRRARPAHGQRERAAGRQAQPVAEAGEYHQAFDLMIAVGATAARPAASN